MKATLGDPTWWPARAMKRSASAIIIKHWPPELEVDAEQLPKVAAFLQPAVRRALRRRLGQTPDDGADRRGAQRAVDTQLGQPGPAGPIGPAPTGRPARRRCCGGGSGAASRRRPAARLVEVHRVLPGATALRAGDQAGVGVGAQPNLVEVARIAARDVGAGRARAWREGSHDAGRGRATGGPVSSDPPSGRW